MRIKHTKNSEPKNFAQVHALLHPPLSPEEWAANVGAKDKIEQTIKKRKLRCVYFFDLEKAPWASALCLDRKGQLFAVTVEGMNRLTLAESFEWMNDQDCLSDSHSTPDDDALDTWREMLLAGLRQAAA